MSKIVFLSLSFCYLSFPLKLASIAHFPSLFSLNYNPSYNIVFLRLCSLSSLLEPSYQYNQRVGVNPDRNRLYLGPVRSSTSLIELQRILSIPDFRSFLRRSGASAGNFGAKIRAFKNRSTMVSWSKCWSIIVFLLKTSFIPFLEHWGNCWSVLFRKSYCVKLGLFELAWIVRLAFKKRAIKCFRICLKPWFQHT